MEKPITENLGGRPRSQVARPRGGGTARRFARLLIYEIANDGLADIGAMMAYYAILSLFPMLVFVVTLALLVVPGETVLSGIAMITQAMPEATRDQVTTQVMTLLRTANAGFAVGGALLALWGASRGVHSLMGALNAMFNRRERRPWWKRQLIALAVTLGVALLAVVALGLLVIGPAAGHWIADRFGLGHVFDVAWDIGRWLGAGLLIMLVWAVLYKFLPDRDAPFRIFTAGAVIGVFLWLAISYGFGVFLSYFGRYASTYGALGGGIIFLTWLWLSNIALLVGAEINDVIATLRTEQADDGATG
jgi:membrane protein